MENYNELVNFYKRMFVAGKELTGLDHTRLYNLKFAEILSDSLNEFSSAEEIELYIKSLNEAYESLN